MPEFITEKVIAICCLTILGGIALFTLEDPTAIVTGAIGAIGGFTASEVVNRINKP